MTYLDEFGNEPAEGFYGGAAGGGKLSHVNDQILTPFGWKRNGDIQAGDVVVDPRTGGSARVIIAHPIQRVAPWRVTFEDGSFLDVGEDHLWTYRPSGKRSKSQVRIRRGDLVDGWLDGYLVGTTAMLRDAVSRADSQQDRGTRANWVNIPVARATEFTVQYRYPDSVWPVDPYVLGVMIGDGSCGDSMSITTIDEEIARWVDEAYPGETIRRDHKTIGVNKGRLKSGIEAVGLGGKHAWDKFIPERYKIAPLRVRVPLMQGLIDTDGYIDDRGHISYTTTSKQLAQDVKWLAQSLGSLVNITEKDAFYTTEEGWRVPCRKAYTVWIKPHDPAPFARLSRKSDRIIDQQSIPSRRVVSVERLDSDPVDMRCITLDTRDGLYIVGDFIVTHNSEALLMGASQYVETPGYAALLVRKTFADLAQPGAIMDRAKDWWYGTRARWVDDTKTWHFPSGATITFGYLDRDDDYRNYMGSEFQFIGFDELTQHDEAPYSKVGSRLRRTTKLKVPLRRRNASNPGGRGHEWVRSRFIDPGSPEVFFIPAGLDDNPSLSRDEYRKTLEGLDPITRAHLLYGDWNIVGGGAVFKRADFDTRDREPLEWERLVRFWDTAATGPTEESGDRADYTVGVLAGLHPSGEIWILDVARDRLSPSGVERLIRTTAEADGFQVEIFIEQEPGASGKMVIDHYQTRVLPEYDVLGFRASGKKEHRAVPYANQVTAHRVVLLRGEWILAFFQEHEAFPYGNHDDQVDAASGAVQELAAGQEMRPARPELAEMFSRF